MHKIGITVKFFLYKIGLFCHDRARMVNILQDIFWRLRQRMTIGITAHLTGRAQDACINQISQNYSKIISEFVVIVNLAADVIEVKLISLFHSLAIKNPIDT